MDNPPPFGSFQRPRVLDALEAKQTRIIDPRWISLFMARIRERDAFRSAKKNLSGASSGAPTAPPRDGGGGRGDPEKPPRKPFKGGGRAYGKGKDKETTK